jgi:hypothetical protein
MPYRNGKSVVWKYSKNIHQFLNPDTKFTLSQRAEKIKEELKEFDSKQNIKYILEDLLLAGKEEDVNYFDEALDDLYDWADENLVGLGI